MDVRGLMSLYTRNVAIVNSASQRQMITTYADSTQTESTQ